MRESIKMKKQILYPDFVSRVFAVSLDLSLCVIFILPITNFISMHIALNNIKKLAKFYGLDVNASDIVYQLGEIPGIADKASSFEYVVWYLIPLFINVILMGLYCVFFWNKFGATPGKYILGMKIANSDDYTKPPLLAFIKRFCYYFTIPVGVWSVIFSSRGISLHDKLSGTVVIKR